MTCQRALKICLGFPLLLLAYLGAAAAWALSVVGEVIDAYPVPWTGTALPPAKQAILLRNEDPAFFDHRGVSLANGQGATTLSSSLAREAECERHVAREPACNA